MKVKSNASSVAKALEKVIRQIPAATRDSLNATAKDIVKAENLSIKNIFDNPVAATKKAVTVIRGDWATYKKHKVTVRVKDSLGKGNSPAQWLSASIKGGVRRRKRSEKALANIIGHRGMAIPAYDYPRNQKGNVTGARYTKALNSLKARDGKFFRGRKQNRNIIFEKTTKADKEQKSTNIRPFLILINRATYKRKFRFFPIAGKITSRVFQGHYTSSFKKQLRSARWK